MKRVTVWDLRDITSIEEVKGFHSTQNAKVYKDSKGSLYLFSYNTLIARITENDIAFTEYHAYSSTTHKHLNKFINKYWGFMYADKRHKHVKENGYLGKEISL